jgi:hypothetical protein
MNIQPFKTESVSLPPKPAVKTAKPANEPVAEDAPQVAKREKLAAALANEPEVRPEEIARGKALAADPDYPSDDLLAKLAGIFVNDGRRSK